MTLLQSRDTFIDFLNTALIAKSIPLKVSQSETDLLEVNAINLAVITEGVDLGAYPSSINNIDISLDVLVNDKEGVDTITSERKASLWCGLLLEILQQGRIIIGDGLKVTWDIVGADKFVSIQYSEYIHKHLTLNLKTY